VDSTGGNVITAKKVLEIALAVLLGNAEYNATTRVWEVKGRDGNTVIGRITESSGGNRTNSTVV